MKPAQPTERSILARFSWFLAPALLAACSVGPDYRPPSIDAGPASFVNGGAPEFSRREVERNWWQQFNDAGLSRLVDLAVRNNRDLKAAEANLREARALYLQAGLDLLPTVTSRASYTEQKRSVGALNNRAFVPRELKLYSMGFDASWEIDLFGRVRRNVESRDAEMAGQEADYRDLAVSLVAEVARNYFTLRGLQNQLEVARKNADNQAATLKLTEVRLEAGRGTELDTSRAKAQLDTTQATVPPIESAIHQTIHRLGVLTGNPPTALAGELLAAAPMPTTPATIAIGNPADLLRRRPDIRVAERDLAAATAQIGVATADLFPRVTFVGSIALEGRTLGALAGTGGESYSVGPRITWAAFDLERVYARIKAADARAEAGLARYEQTVLNALEETENALVEYNRARQERALLADAALASQRACELAHLRFDDGIADFLTVLDTESRLLEDQQRLAASETRTATALVAVYKALGGGWENGSALRAGTSEAR
ncbi:MAG: efflux transporter outer membrane subunit [Methylococcaceae bacterium]|nr:efflux transporter outer membrane subunit [Methylococcaceae bacterium]